jgi:hypothetical protein
MTDAQMITLAVAILAVFAGTIFNNSRITDLRDSVNRRLDDSRDSVNRHIEDKFARLDGKLDHIIEMLATYDARITKLGG